MNVSDLINQAPSDRFTPGLEDIIGATHAAKDMVRDLQDSHNFCGDEPMEVLQKAQDQEDALSTAQKARARFYDGMSCSTGGKDNCTSITDAMGMPRCEYTFRHNSGLFCQVDDNGQGTQTQAVCGSYMDATACNAETDCKFLTVDRKEPVSQPPIITSLPLRFKMVPQNASWDAF